MLKQFTGARSPAWWCRQACHYLKQILLLGTFQYCKATEPLYHSFMCSLVSLFFSSIYPLPAMHSLLVTSDVRNIPEHNPLSLEDFWATPKFSGTHPQAYTHPQPTHMHTHKCTPTNAHPHTHIHKAHAHALGQNQFSNAYLSPTIVHIVEGHSYWRLKSDTKCVSSSLAT